MLRITNQLAEANAKLEDANLSLERQVAERAGDEDADDAI
jgi:hypothetical protein